MRLVESVQDATLDSLRHFIEQADRSGARGDTPVAMTRARNGGVLTIAVDFEPTPFLTVPGSTGYPIVPGSSVDPLPRRPGTYTEDDTQGASIARTEAQ